MSPCKLAHLILPALLLAIATIASPTEAALQQADVVMQARANGWMNSVASGWTPNLGQIADTDGHVASSVYFSASIADAQVYVTASGISHYFLRRHAEEQGESETETRGEGQQEIHKVDWARLDLELKGANIRLDRAVPENPLLGQGGTNYYLPQCPDGAQDVPTYGTISFSNVYPGIDWVIRSEPGAGAHHDFIVHPGADATQIQLEYAGATEIRLSADARSLLVRTSLGEVREGALSCYQGDRSHPIGARFQIEGNTVSVVLDDYDHSAPLVIDPPLLWSTYYGGTGYDGPRSIYCDNTREYIYVVGYNASFNLPVQNPGGGSYFQGTLNGAQDAFIWKFNQLGVRQWATYYGGSANELGADCAVDVSGNLYVCGITGSTNLPTQAVAGAYNQATISGPEDAFILKFNSSGVRQWATYFGGKFSDYANAITAGPGGQVFVCGTTTSPDMPVVNPGGGAYFQGALGGTSDAFILRFSTIGALEWGTYYGGAPGAENGHGITATTGQLYVIGTTRSTVFPTLNPGAGAYFQPALAGDEDTFISRFNMAGVRSWSTYFGGDSTDTGDEPVVDSNGNLFVCGYTLSTTLPTFNPGGSAYFQGALAGTNDMFIAKFSSSNAPLWSTYFGGSADDYLQGLLGKPLAVDALGRVYMTGATLSPDLPVLNPGAGSFFQGTFSGSSDATLTQFANDGTLLWSTYFGTPNADFGSSVAVGAGGCLFATGESVLSGNLVTVNPGFGAWYQSANAGSDDGYIAKFCSANSACCLDFSCVAVTTQGQCTAMGGAFYPDQPCSTTVCTLNCKICGRKFNDINRNGVQDNGEPGLPGWSIALYYPNGSLFATETTGVNGNYCFNNIPCGTWTVSEIQQPGWVQTYPSPASHTVSLGTGSTQNGINFGNYACATTTPCAGMPSGVAARWAFNGGPGATSSLDITHTSPPRNVAQIIGGGSTSTDDAMCLTSTSEYALVPAADQLGLDFALGSFSIATWIEPALSSVSPRMIAEKRELTSSSTYEMRGWALYLIGLQSYMEIGTGSAPQLVPGPSVAGGAWSHLVVSLDRDAGQGRWYLNGAPVPAFDFVPLTGSVSNGADVYIGQRSPAFGAAPGFHGCIGDLALLSGPVTAAAASKAYDPGPIGWCPEFALMPQVKTICKNDSIAQVCFNIVNNNGTPQSYRWSLAGLPAGPGCTVAGPTQFVPSAGVILVPAGSTSPPICVTIKRPAGLTAQNATACFMLTFFNSNTGICRTRTAMLRADNSCWCATPVPIGAVAVPARVPSGAIIGIGIRNPCDPIATLAYKLSAVWLDTNYPDPLALSLNGLPPGTPVYGAVSDASGAGATVDVMVSYPHGYDPAARYEIVIEGDTDGDGIMERLNGTVVEAAYDSTGTVGVTIAPAPERSTRLRTTPNPFMGGSLIEFTLAFPEEVDLGIYDLSGRLVRSLSHCRLSAGAHRFPWDGHAQDGRRAAAGVYFARLDGNGRRLQAKLIKMK